MPDLILAGIGWEPEIRGALTVVLGCTVLMGSVWLLLATNTGVRLGTLIALAGFFGWMFIMGLIWWMYGIGYVGDNPTWEGREIVVETATDAEIATEHVEQVSSNAGQPRAIDLVRDMGDEDVNAELDTVDEEEITARLTEANETLAVAAAESGIDDPRVLSDEQLAAAIDQAIDDANQRNEQLTLTQLKAVAPELIEEATDAGLIDPGVWRLVDAAEAGEAQTSATAVVLEEGVFDDSGEFIVVDTYQRGGKPRRDGDSIWSRVTNRIEKISMITHPTNYTVVQLQRTLDKPTVPGQAAPFAEPDPDSPIISVVMVRNLGNQRLQPALITFISLLLFSATCLALHQRDSRFRESEAAFAAGA